jgi:hypothetical protein
MKKIWSRMGKWLMFVLVIAAASLFAFCILKMNRMQVTLNELMSQMFYLQDSTSVLQSDLNTMETNIEAALEQESSLIEDYSITVTDCNFAKGTYSVDITVLPKEYTEATQLTIYFGTRSYNLTLSGISFKGSATLSMANDYSGNVTVLFTNGEKRSTEVLSGYKDFQTTLKQAISGAVSSVEDSYQDGEWAVNGTVDYELDGQNSFSFESFHLIAEVGADTVYDYDLLHETGGAIAQEPLDEVLPGEEPTTDQTGGGPADGTTGATDDQTDEVTGAADNLTIGIMDIPSVGAASDTVDNIQDDAENQTGTVMGTETEQTDGITDEITDGETAGDPEGENVGDEDADLTTQETAESSETASVAEDQAISGMHGSQTMEFTCPAAETDTVKIYLTAVTKEGITLKLTLFEGTLRSNTELRISDLMTYTPVLDYYDKNQVKY